MLQRLFQKMCLNEIKKIETFKYNESDVLSLMKKIKKKINKLLILVFKNNKINCVSNTVDI